MPASAAPRAEQPVRPVASGVPVVPTPGVPVDTDTGAIRWRSTPRRRCGASIPNIAAPHVHQVSVGIQREIGWSTAVEARYVGTFGRGIWRGTDFNQVKISPEFLADFNRARSNGFLADAGRSCVQPGVQPRRAGQPAADDAPELRMLTNANVVNNLQTNQVAGLADFYMTNRVPGSLATFMQNPAIYASQGLSNGGFSDYNSLQFEVRRQFRNGFFGQVHYTWSDTKTDSAGTGQNRFEAFMDNLRPELNTGRSVFHLTHAVAANAIYELPFGDRQEVAQLERRCSTRSSAGGSSDRSSRGRADRRSASRRSARRSTAPAARIAPIRSPATRRSARCRSDEIKNLLGIYKVGGQDLLDRPEGHRPGDRPRRRRRQPGERGRLRRPGVLQPWRRGGRKPFDPERSTARRSSASTSRSSKRIRITDRHRFELKGEAFNLTNTPSFFRGDMDINSTTFGRLTSVNVGSRVVQLSIRYEF